jgi:Flp pilus assembly protein TadD
MALSIDVASLLHAAVTLHQAGRLGEAEHVYLRILAVQPRHFDSLHLLGVVFSQRGEDVAAVRQMDAAIEVNPNIS